MKCLSYKQPWASLVMARKKRVETRPVNYTVLAGRWHAVHASNTWARDQQALFDTEPFKRVLMDMGVTAGNACQTNLPRGAILGVAFVASQGPPAAAVVTQTERAFGDYTPGRWASYLGEVFPLDQPLIYTGRLGVWDLPAEVERQVLIRLQWFTDQLPPELTSEELLNAAVNRARAIALQQQEVDAAISRLRGGRPAADTRSPIERMIDQATGYEGGK